MTEQQPLLEVRGLVKHFAGSAGSGRAVPPVRAVDGVDLDIYPGDMLGLVGESGSGKTTTGQTILRMNEATAGSVSYRGQDIMRLPRRRLGPLRRRLQYIFQDPYGALNPRLTVLDAIGEPLITHGLAEPENVRDRAAEILRVCGLGPEALDRYPHQFSGGQRQRIVIARAMGLQPEFVVADEPASSLDVSIQAQIINLFSDLRESRQTAFIFISHDLSVVEHLCNKVAIMFRGVIVEQGTRDQIFGDPIHPYTQELLAAVPVADPRHRRRHAGANREWVRSGEDREPLLDVGDGHLVALPGLER